jgi:NADH-quinone oxidoreductase subunit M
MIIFLIFLPFLGILILILIEEDQMIKKFSLLWTVFVFFINILIGIFFDSLSYGSVFLTELDKIELGSFILGIDSISYYLIILTTLTFPICIIAS